MNIVPVCEKCGKNKHKSGFYKGGKQRYRCSCSSAKLSSVKFQKNNESFKKDTKELKDLIDKKTVFVITSCQNDTKINKKFFDSLLGYTKKNNAVLMVIPIRYKNPSAYNLNPSYGEYSWPKEVREYLIENTIFLNQNCKIVADLYIQATDTNPIASLNPITMGKTTIVGHPQLQMTTVPVNHHHSPIILTTTGTISNKNYSESKVGYKANFNHCFSAIVVEVVDSKEFHLRQLIADDSGGFYDLEWYYNGENVRYDGNVEALITGDEHIYQLDQSVFNATYISENSIVKTLKPKQIIRHDVLDCYSISHHHEKNRYLQYVKNIEQSNNIEDELFYTCKVLQETTPVYSTSIVVESNHHNHLMKWLNEGDPKSTNWSNLYIYHKLWSMLLEAAGPFHTKLDVHTNPFELYFNNISPNFGGKNRVKFLSNIEPYYIKDILISMHGDQGPNGSKGTRKNLSTLSDKSVIGHSHSPGIEKGCYQVGTSSKKSLEYNKGPSSWMHTHCIIHNNGKRQLVSIVNGKWRA